MGNPWFWRSIYRRRKWLESLFNQIKLHQQHEKIELIYEANSPQPTYHEIFRSWFSTIWWLFIQRYRSHYGKILLWKVQQSCCCLWKSYLIFYDLNGRSIWIKEKAHRYTLIRYHAYLGLWQWTLLDRILHNRSLPQEKLQGCRKIPLYDQKVISPKLRIKHIALKIQSRIWNFRAISTTGFISATSRRNFRHK